MKLRNWIVAACAVWASTGSAVAAVSAEDAKALGTTLTPFGAEKAGSADGNIPAYTGRITTFPAAYKAKSGIWANPYSSEKPLYSVTAQNMDKYADKLSDGTKELLKRFPTYRLDVYPSHRDVGYPQSYLDASIKNATSAKLVGPNDGDGVEGAWGGVPFPIPKTGAEVIWNHKLRYYNPALELNNTRSYLVDAAGNVTLIAAIQSFYKFLYHDPAEKPGDWAVKYPNFHTAPARSAGTGEMIWEPMNYANTDLVTYSYSPGQRRVRLAPEATYDTPAAVYGGAIIYDEINLFTGRMDRFDWKLAGKKEMLVPYHLNDLENLPTSKSLGPKHLNPDVVRWELHRVWVVESTLKPGKRHIYEKRNFYVDEDSWVILMSDAFDHAGKLYRVGFNDTFAFYDDGYGVTAGQHYYDLNKGVYALGTVTDGQPGIGFYVLNKFPADVPLTGDGLAGYGVR